MRRLPISAKFGIRHWPVVYAYKLNVIWIIVLCRPYGAKTATKHTQTDRWARRQVRNMSAPLAMVIESDALKKLRVKRSSDKPAGNCTCHDAIARMYLPM